MSKNDDGIKKTKRQEYNKKYWKKWYSQNKEKHVKNTAEWMKRNPDKVKKSREVNASKRNYKNYMKNYMKNRLKNDPGFKKKHKDAVRRSQQRRRMKERLLVIKHYSKNSMKCACCGETLLEALTVDHIAGNGKEHRNEVGNKIISWLIKNNFPKGYQILCYNCNITKRQNKECPHKTGVSYFKSDVY